MRRANKGGGRVRSGAAPLPAGAKPKSKSKASAKPKSKRAADQAGADIYQVRIVCVSAAARTARECDVTEL